MPSLLSQKPIEPRDRLIFALDVPTLEEALAWVERLGDAVTVYKLGLEFCMGEPFALRSNVLHAARSKLDLRRRRAGEGRDETARGDSAYELRRQ
jgi:hypothetical protein